MANSRLKHPSGIGIIALIVIVGLFELMPIRWRPSRNSLYGQISDAKQVMTACRLYAYDHEGVFPDKLDALLPKYLEDRDLLRRLHGRNETERWIYFGGHKDTDDPNTVLFESSSPVFGRYLFTYIGGQVRHFQVAKHAQTKDEQSGGERR